MTAARRRDRSGWWQESRHPAPATASRQANPVLSAACSRQHAAAALAASFGHSRNATAGARRAASTRIPRLQPAMRGIAAGCHASGLSPRGKQQRRRATRGAPPVAVASACRPASGGHGTADAGSRRRLPLRRLPTSVNFSGSDRRMRGVAAGCRCVDRGRRRILGRYARPPEARLEAGCSAAPDPAASPSSRGLGFSPFKAETRVRIPLGTPTRFHRHNGQARRNPETPCTSMSTVTSPPRFARCR